MDEKMAMGTHSWEVNIDAACCLGHQRHPQLDCPSQILMLGQPAAPETADVALGTQHLFDPPLIHFGRIAHSAEVSVAEELEQFV